MDDSSETLIEQLKGITLCASLPDYALRRMAAVVQAVEYADGQVIMLQGEVNTPAFLIVKGIVRAFRTNMEGREQTITILRAGDSFNLPIVLLPNQAAPVSAAAVGPTRLLRIEADDLLHLLEQTPEIALATLRDLAAKLVYLTNLVHDLSLRSVRGRLARFLLAQAQSGTASRWTQDEIAAQIGTVREVVSRTMRAFAQEKLIEFDRHKIVILNPQALRCEAEF